MVLIRDPRLREVGQEIAAIVVEGDIVLEVEAWHVRELTDAIAMPIADDPGKRIQGFVQVLRDYKCHRLLNSHLAEAAGQDSNS